VQHGRLVMTVPEKALEGHRGIGERGNPKR
jgi:hypothetical protein